MAQPTEADILAALGRYRAYIAEVNHRAMSTILPAVETAHIDDPDLFESPEEEEEARLDFFDRLINPPENTQPPIERPSDILVHWDLIVSQLSLDGTSVNADPGWRATKRDMYRSAILDGLGRLECPTGQWSLPLDFEILMRHVDSLQGHGWSKLRDETERLIFWVGWGGPGSGTVTHEKIQKRVMTGQAIVHETIGSFNYDIAGGWLTGVGRESRVYVAYTRPTGDESQCWSWRYLVTLGQFGDERFDDIVGVLDWYKHHSELHESEFEVTTAEIFAP
ncbi:hypothetical protein B0J13DRAFT_572146 [Dactylonectria estremocensis]|uniref:Uncharacterized protein n=1 Tax=Dactylonectria estremocensis TaxID=1079267 RepID=A0A9P9IC68_9HYPO|nr:hypothetical protein B0J13DRAFT_572146 [Dactylonectria estremocensis]